MSSSPELIIPAKVGIQCFCVSHLVIPACAEITSVGGRQVAAPTDKFSGRALNNL
ncbi:MAG: hypothetical protein LBQ75_08770 [Zoogloeaceae bacterium]|nr:hypothetical protein [Zoogloeaceae bacterium]